MNYWKWGALAAVIIAMFFLGRCNGRQSVLRNTVTSATHDSLVFVSVPIPVKEERDDSIVYMTHTEHGTLEIEGPPVPGPIVYLPEGTPQSVANDLNDYRKTRIYDTTFYSDRGDTIKVSERVTHNKLTQRSIRALFTDSLKTIILRPPRRTVGYFTLGAGANMDKDLEIAGGFALKNKNDRVYQFELQKISRIKQPVIKATVFFPIRLIKTKE